MALRLSEEEVYAVFALIPEDRWQRRHYDDPGTSIDYYIRAFYNDVCAVACHYVFSDGGITPDTHRYVLEVIQPEHRDGKLHINNPIDGENEVLGRVVMEINGPSHSESRAGKCFTRIESILGRKTDDLVERLRAKLR